MFQRSLSSPVKLMSLPKSLRVYGIPACRFTTLVACQPSSICHFDLIGRQIVGQREREAVPNVVISVASLGGIVVAVGRHAGQVAGGGVDRMAVGVSGQQI